MAQMPASLSQTSPMAIGRRPLPPGFSKPMRVLSSNAGRCGRVPLTMTLTKRSVAQRALLSAEQATLMCSYVQPLGPGAEPAGSACSTVPSSSLVICTGAVAGCRAGGGCSGGCSARSVANTSSVGSAIGRACRHLDARLTFPCERWRCMRAATLCNEACAWRER